MKAFHAIIQGEVQGVGFRMSAVMRAESLGLKGWVRNTEDGNVEVWAEGEPAALDQFAEWLSIGPAAARIDKVLLTEEQASGDLQSISVAF